MSNLTLRLMDWREDRNIINPNTKEFVSNILEELLEIYYADKEMIKACKNDIMSDYFCLPELNEINTIDAIQDIQVFCINETELKHMSHPIGEAFCSLYRLNDNGEYKRNLEKAKYYIETELQYLEEGRD